MPKTLAAYISLHRADGTEPLTASGYARAYLGEVELWDIPKIPGKLDIVFNDITTPGCGHIAEYRLYDCPKGGEPLYIWHLSEPVNVHAGVIPVIHEGRLLLGVDVSAQILLKTANLCALT